MIMYKMIYIMISISQYKITHTVIEDFIHTVHPCEIIIYCIKEFPFFFWLKSHWDYNLFFERLLTDS